MYKRPDEPSQTGHTMIAVNLDAIVSREEMAQRMAAYYRRVKSSPVWDPDGEMFLPGELEYRMSEQRRQNGIPLPANLHQELLVLATEFGIGETLPTLQAA
jgi:LDH2 family malate/lactate/ureidoglycolate dehydrogenase